MKIFISHKQEDGVIAARLGEKFKAYNIDTYLDLIDDTISRDGKTLTEHIRKSLNACTDIIVVMSEKTKFSQWVPFEVGMSAQKDMPTVTFMVEDVELPEFLDYWPSLKHFSDVEKYLKAKSIASINESHNRGNGMYGFISMPPTDYFYKTLKEML